MAALFFVTRVEDGLRVRVSGTSGGAHVDGEQIMTDDDELFDLPTMVIDDGIYDPDGTRRTDLEALVAKGEPIPDEDEETTS